MFTVSLQPFIIDRNQIDFLTNQLIEYYNYKGPVGGLELTYHVKYPPQHPGILPSGSYLNEIDFPKRSTDLYTLISEFIGYKDLFQQYPSLDKILFQPSTTTATKSIKFIYYIFNNGRVDFIKQIRNTDVAALNEEINKDISYLDELGILYHKFDNSIYIADIDSVSFWLIQSVFDDVNSSEVPRQLKETDLKLLITKYPQHVRSFMEANIFYYPDYMKLFENEPSQYENLYELGLLYLEGNKYDEPDPEFSKEVYLLLANIITANPGENLTKKERILALDYLMKAGDLPEAQRVRNRIFWSWAGRLGSEPFDITLDAEMLLNFIELIKKK